MAQKGTSYFICDISDEMIKKVAASYANPDLIFSRLEENKFVNLDS